MSLLEAVVLGFVQGITEFLPISSTAHLIIVPKFMGWQEPPLVFDTTLHLATAAALILYFWKDLVAILLALVKDILYRKMDLRAYSQDSVLGLKILVGSIPAGILGFFYESAFEEVFRGIITVAVFLLLGSFLMFVAEKFFRHTKSETSFLGSFCVGLFQSLALFPGVSRSGATISGSMMVGLNRKEAARFSFLLSIPIVVLAGMYKLVSSFGQMSTVLIPLSVGFLTSTIVGVMVIGFLIRFLSKKDLTSFIVYRLVLAFLLVVVYVAH